MVSQAVRGSPEGTRDMRALRATAIAHTLDQGALCLYSSVPGQ